MKIRSRPASDVDPLEEGTKYLAHVGANILVPHYRNAVPGSVKLSVTVHNGQVITEIGYVEHDGTVHTEYNVENVRDVLNG